MTFVDVGDVLFSTHRSYTILSASVGCKVIALCSKDDHGSMITWLLADYNFVENWREQGYRLVRT